VVGVCGVGGWGAVGGAVWGGGGGGGGVMTHTSAEAIGNPLPLSLSGFCLGHIQFSYLNATNSLI